MESIQLLLQYFISIKLQPILDSFIKNITLESFLKFIVLYFFVIWISIIVWVYKDITNRTANVLYQIFSLLLVLIFTPFGIFVYLLIRPIQTIPEKYYTEIEQNLDILSEIISHTIVSCPECKKEISSHYSTCPHCHFSLVSACKGCGKSVFFDWKICPYCAKKNTQKSVEEKKEKKELKKDPS